MKAVILAAGYGVRLERELQRIKESDIKDYGEIRGNIEGRSKPMVLIAGKPLIEYIVQSIEKIKEIDRIIIITNNKFFSQFEEWSLGYRSTKEIRLINDGTDINEDRLGSVGDLLLALDREAIDEDILVLAGDNLFAFDLNEMVDLFMQKGSDIIVVYPEEKERIKRSACVELDRNGRVIGFEEKPQSPKTNLACPAAYIYKRSTVKLIKKIRFGPDIRDLLGNIPLALYKSLPIYALKKGTRIRFDLGTIDDFRAAVKYAENMKRL